MNYDTIRYDGRDADGLSARRIAAVRRMHGPSWVPFRLGGALPPPPAAPSAIAESDNGKDSVSLPRRLHLFNGQFRKIADNLLIAFDRVERSLLKHALYSVVKCPKYNI
ncbi:hypothetical protein EVAR_5455_1 [Eumeta japonica]|uniref:Uncharacterized protein n=1 Tax=Eumeta variegata TaxID=151549 RepID=A0A4C1T9M7_EUMVA|nr:hypothetical protein EVAR_5455_1 [Eumeta japonica]